MNNKFNAEEFYIHDDYKLLPFRFTPLDDNKLILTNMVGEYVVINNDELTNIVDRKPLKLSLKESLLSKHIIYDGKSNIPLMLTGLKYRTKMSRLKNFTSLHMIVTTLRCDYTCSYCQVSRQGISSNKSDYDMSISTADNVIDMIFSSPSKALKIEFQGGESLLNFEVIKHIVEKSTLRAKGEFRVLQFVVATNLSPLNDEILNFLKKHNILVSTSLGA